MNLPRLSTLALCCLLPALPTLVQADDATKADPRYPFRTDFANAELPWYLPKPGEFPPHHSDHRVGGELVAADFLHRTGQFRTTKTGELIEFTMPTYGAINYLNSEADLRDVPLGTFFLFFLNQDANGGFTRLATMQDQFTMDGGHGFSYRLDEIHAQDGKLLTTKHSVSKDQPDLGKKELLVKADTRIWKGESQVKLGDLAAGDELLFNLTGKTSTNPGWCTDIWVGADTHKLATEKQRKKFADFTKFRGLPAWIDKTEGNKITATLFSGDSQNFKSTFLGADFVVDRDVSVVVANDELRTWNPPVDRERGKVLAVQDGPRDCYGSSGVRLVLTVRNMLEGFRKGRIVRIFAGPWPVKDQPYGESLMGYGFEHSKTAEVVENLAKEYPSQFPYRTDYGNEQLPWYQLQPDKVPPQFSDHVVHGALVSIDAAKRTGRFVTDRTAEVVEFSLLPKATVRYLATDVTLSDLPIGTRCHFHLYQDEKGAFSQANLIEDEFSYLVSNGLTYRVEAAKLNEGKLYVVRQMPLMKNYNGDMEQPPDIGRQELLVSSETRVWKGAQEARLADLATGDLLLVNATGEGTGQPSHCTEIWVGEESRKLATERQSKKLAEAKKP